MGCGLSTLTIEDMKQGAGFSFEQRITEDMIDQFTALSGDCSSLHVDSAFARKRGFAKRVAHGALLTALISRLIGVHLPGQNALLLSLNLRFSAPTYGGDEVRVTGAVDQISLATRTVIFKVAIENIATGLQLVAGKAHVAFTQELAKED